MTAIKLDGLATAKAIKAELAERVIHLKQKGITPGLGTLLVGDDPGSHSYVAGKHRDCAEVGMASVDRRLPSTATQDEVHAVIDELNADPSVDAFIVQDTAATATGAAGASAIEPSENASAAVPAPAMANRALAVRTTADRVRCRVRVMVIRSAPVPGD